MTINIDELKKKIIYRSNYRGTKEMDKLLGTFTKKNINYLNCLLYTSPSPRDRTRSRMPSSA